MGGKHKGDLKKQKHLRKVSRGGLQKRVHLAQVRGHGDAQQIREPLAEPVGKGSHPAPTCGPVLVQVLLHGGALRQLSGREGHLRALDEMEARGARLALLPQIRRKDE